MKIVSLLRHALVFVAILGMSAAVAKGVVWEVPLYAMLPSAMGLGQQVVAPSANGESRLYVSTSWSAPSDSSGSQYEIASVLALDLGGGARLWQRDLYEECGRRRDVSVSGKFVAALRGGDVAVAFELTYLSGTPLFTTFVCYARLSGSDGRVLWSYVDTPAASGPQTFALFAIASDPHGDLVVTGLHGYRPYTAKMSGQDGRPLWTTEGESIEPSYLSGTIDVDMATGDVVVMTAAPFENGFRPQIQRLNGTNGRVRWSQTICESFFYEAMLRKADTGTIAFALRCRAPGSIGDVLTFGHLAYDDGATLWQRSLRHNSNTLVPDKYEIDASGDLCAIGDLDLDGVALGAACFAADDGRVRWSLPDKLGGQIEGTNESSILSMAVGGGRLHVWELIGDTLASWANTTRLSSYDARTGQLLGREDVGDSQFDLLYRAADRDASRLPRMTALSNGAVALSAISDGIGGNAWLWLALARPAPDLAWMRRELLSAPQPMLSAPVVSGASGSVLAASHAGIAGVIVAGLAEGNSTFNAFQMGVPHLVKIAQDDGRVLWRWQPLFDRPSSQGDIRGVAADSAASAYTWGHWERAPKFYAEPFVARVDTIDGTPRWQRPLEVMALALDASGRPFVANRRTLQLLSVADGMPVWSVVLSDTETYGPILLVVDAHGDPVVSTFHGGGLRVAKFRASDGALVWQQQLSDLWLSDEQLGLQALSNGDVVLMNPPTRLAGASGEIVWQRSDLYPVRILAGDDGQLVLADVWKNRDSGEQAQFTRLDADTGETLWSVTYPEDSTGSTMGTAPMAFDGSGDLFVMNGKQGGYNLARLAGSDGAMNWQVGITVSEFLPSPPTDILHDGGRLFERLFVAADIDHFEESHSIATVFRIDMPTGLGHSRRPLPDSLRRSAQRPLR